MAVFLTQSNRDLSIDQTRVRFISPPSTKNSQDEVTIILYPDSLVSKYKCASRGSHEILANPYKIANGMVLTKIVTSELKKSKSPKSLLNCTLEHMAAINIFKVFVQAKSLRNLSALLAQLNSFIRESIEHSHYFTSPFIMLTNLDGLPVRSSCELLTSKIVISSSRRLTKLELLSIIKIEHKIPALNPESSSFENTSSRVRGRSLVINQMENFDVSVSQVDIQTDKQKDLKSSFESDGSAQSSGFETTSDWENLTSLLKSAKIIEECWLQEFIIHEEIGRGNFATVHRCERKNHTNINIAVKLIQEDTYKTRCEYIKREIDIISSLRFFEDLSDINDEFSAKSHPNIIICYCIYYKPTIGLAIFTEYANNGDLFSYISDILAVRDVEKSHPCLDEKTAAIITYQILSALDYLRHYDIVHRDIKPENVLLHKTEDSDINVKLCDFGLAVQIDQSGISNRSKCLTGICGTPYYIAPEMLLQEGYGIMVDVWAVGVVLFVILAGYPPFYSENEDQDEIFDKILECELDLNSEKFSFLSQEVCILLYSLLCFEPDFRILPSQAMEQPWFKKLMS